MDCGFILILLWSIFSLAILTITVVDAFKDYANYNLLVREGVLTTGVVTEKYYEHTKSKRGFDSWYRVTYEYTALVNGSPASLESRMSVSRSRYSKYEVGQEIEVLYAASNPEISAAKAGFGPPSIFSILLFAALAIWIAYLGLKEMSKSFGGVSFQLKPPSRRFEKWLKSLQSTFGTFFSQLI
jgi:hypothetical protein